MERRAPRRGSWDEFNALVDQIARSGSEGDPPGEELMAHLRVFAARRAATGASAMVARHDVSDDSASELYPREHKRSRTGASDALDLMKWGDEELLNLLIRVPFAWHQEVRAVCRRFNTLVKDDEFCRMRIEFKCAEHGCIFAGGRFTNYHPTTSCTLLATTRTRPIAPLITARISAAPLAPPPAQRAIALRGRLRALKITGHGIVRS